MRKRIALLCVVATVAAAGAARAQDPAPRDTVEVLPPDHPLRPQPPPRPDIGVGEHIGHGIARVLRLPFEYVGTALEGTLIPIEESRGGFAAGLSATTAGPTKRGHISYTGGSLGTRSGILGGGIKVRVLPDPVGPQLGFSAAVTNRGYQEYTAWVGWNDAEEHPYARVTGYYDLDSMDEFWGLGPDSDPDNEVSFSWEKYGGVAAIGIPEGRIVWGSAYVSYERTSVFRGREVNVTDLVDAFPDLVFSDLELWGPGATLALDLRDDPGYPKKGVLLQGTGELWRSINSDDVEWFRYAAEAAAHIPLGSDWHILSAKAGFDAVEPEGSSDFIPFAYLPTIGGSQTLRGFASWRWRDRAVAYGTAELRWRIWLEHTPDPESAGALEVAIFYDVGQVAPRLEDIEFDKDRKTAYGLLARFYLLAEHVMTFGVGRSEEEMRFVFTLNNSW